jgi:predicted amidohydrolase YtcJ
MDGALGAHGAWLLEPYNDLPESRGLNTISLDVFEESAEIAIQNGFQLCTHAIGDRANRKTLDIYEKVLKKYPQATDLRWRIEHAQHLHPDDIGRFAELGVIPAMQTVHCTSDGPWVIKKLGEKRSREGAYVWRSLIDSGTIIPNGTDSPVESINPFENFYSAVTRKMSNGESFYPGQVMSREEALSSYTINPAYAAFEEDIKGTLKVGKLADIVVLSQNILIAPEEKIPETEVVYTILGGKILYQR